MSDIHENGCKFCRNGEKTEHIDNDSLIKFWIYKEKIVAVAEICGERIEFAQKIKFCFMCGRRLGELNNGEMKTNVIAGKPYIIDFNLGILGE